MNFINILIALLIIFLTIVGPFIVKIFIVVPNRINNIKKKFNKKVYTYYYPIFGWLKLFKNDE